MKRIILALVLAATALVAACSKDSGSSNPSNYSAYGYGSCTGGAGYTNPYGAYQLVGSQCMDVVHNTVVQPQFCTGSSVNPGFNNGFGGYPNQGYPNQGYPNQGYPNQGYPGNNSGYGGYPGYNTAGCNPYGFPSYTNPAGYAPYSGVCPYGSYQLYDPRTGVTQCASSSYYSQISPYATPNYYGGSLWFYLYY